MSARETSTWGCGPIAQTEAARTASPLYQGLFKQVNKYIEFTKRQTQYYFNK